MNKKGFTLVEIIVSISLVSIVVIFLFQLITTIKNIYDSQSNRNDTKITVAVITREVEKDLSSFGLESMPTKTCDMTNNNIVPSSATKVQCVKFIYKEENVKFNEGYVVYYENNGKYFLGYKRGKDNIIETQTVREINVAPVDDVSLDIKYKNANDIYSLKVNIPIRDNNDKYDLVINYIDSENSNNNKPIISLVSQIENSYANSRDSNGLMADNTADKNIRYVGANPKNYIYFNEELWRIIGIFNVYNTVTKQYERMVKIVRNDSLGYYSYDTSEEKIYGINNWPTSKLQSELNGDYLNTLLTENPYWYNGNATKTNQFNRSNVIKEEYQQMIGNVRWNLGGSKYANPVDPPYGLPTLEQYNSERGTSVYTGDNITRATTWDGKIGLINASDYGYASTDEDCRNNLRAGVTYTNSTWDYSGSKCKNNNWLQKTIWYWSLTCSSANSMCYAIEASGLANYSVASNSGGVFPSLYLLSDVMITSGTGEKNDPYRMDYNAFRDDSWETIANNVKVGRTSIYHVGSTKQVSINGKNYTLRLANNSTPSECNDSSFSQTACGFVVEFVDAVKTITMNAVANNVGGWPVSEVRTYVNGDFYNNLPEELRKVIIDTKVISGHGSTSGEENFITNDKIYLLSSHEVWSNRVVYNGIAVDTAHDQTRQLDYYKNKGVTTDNHLEAIKQYNGSNYAWWLRTANSDGNNNFLFVGNNGYWYGNYSNVNYGIAPACRIG